MANMLPALRNSLDRLREEIDSTFDRWLPKSRETGRAEPTPGMTPSQFGASLSPSFFSATQPVIDMDEDENEFRVTAELPGLEKDSFKVELKGNQLIIRGEKKSNKEEKKRNYYYSECSYGSFARAVTLPSEVDETKVDAQYKDGILTVHLPKTEQSKAKAIEVKVE